MQKLLIWLALPMVTGSSRQGTLKGSDSHVQWEVFITSPAASAWQVRQLRVTSCGVVSGPWTISGWEVWTGVGWIAACGSSAGGEALGQKTVTGMMMTARVTIRPMSQTGIRFLIEAPAFLLGYSEIRLARWAMLSRNTARSRSSASRMR